MIQRIVIEYNFIEKTVSVVENDFGTFELYGILEAVKVMNTEHWLREESEE